MSKKRIALVIAAVAAAALLLASPLPNFIGLFLYVSIESLFPSTISWDAKNAYLKCFGAIDDPRQWPSDPRAACEAMWLCANEAVMSPAVHDRLYSQIHKTPGCQEP